MGRFLKSTAVAAVLLWAFLAAIAVRFLGTDASTEPASSAGAVSAGGLTVIAGYTHPTPGSPLSHVCGYVTGPPNTLARVRVRDQDGLGVDRSTQVKTDGDGFAQFEVEVVALADYIVTATFGRTVAVDALEVAAAQSNCPARPSLPVAPEQEPLQHALSSGGDGHS